MRPKVLFMAGAGRSGSTVLGSVLGQYDGFFYGGELASIGRKSLKENRLCGFGMPLRESEVWQEILCHAFGDLDRAGEALHDEQTYDPLRTIQMLSAGRRDRYLARRRPFLETLARLYGAIHSQGGGRVILDSSHSPLYGWLLGHVDQLELYILHLIRDPRAVAFSWQRQKVQPDQVESWKMRRLSPAFTTTMWCAANASVERFWPAGQARLLRMRYEDFVARPRGEVQRILDFLGESPAESPFVGQHEVVLGPTPCVFGNPDRFRFGQVALRSDDEWTRRMSRWQRAQVTSLAWPWLWRYGYFSDVRRSAPRPAADAH